jgi:hypothetical protein
MGQCGWAMPWTGPERATGTCLGSEAGPFSICLHALVPLRQPPWEVETRSRTQTLQLHSLFAHVLIGPLAADRMIDWVIAGSVGRGAGAVASHGRGH